VDNKADGGTATRAIRSERLDDGIELLGKYRGSGLHEAPYLVRRGDGQVVQVSRLLYLIAACLDPGRHPDPAERRLDEVAARVSNQFGQEVTVENIAYLIDRKLRRSGLVANDSPSDAPPDPHTRANPLLALRLRLPLVPERAHRFISTRLEPLFHPAVVWTALVGLVFVDVGLLYGQRDDLVAGTRQVIYQPQLLMGITLLTIAAGAFHEIGHATAARYSGATPGAMGAGVYLIWPVFYTDVTDAYRLDRRGRLRTDLGGVYFNVLFALGIASLYLQIGYKPLLVFLVVVQMETLRQFLPFVRLDGYYVVSDLAGVPNLFSYMKPVLVSLFQRTDENARRAAKAKLAELNPRARFLVTAWVCLTAPILAGQVILFLVVAPRLAGAAWGSAGGQLQEMTTHGQLDVIGVINGTVGLVLLTLPIVGVSYVFLRLARRLSSSAKTWWRSRPLATATVAVVAATLVAVQVAVEWPNTFASALKNAQVAQAIEDARDEGRLDEWAAVPVSPAAEASPITSTDPGEDEGADEDPTTSETTETEAGESAGASVRRPSATDPDTSTTASPTTVPGDGSPSKDDEAEAPLTTTTGPVTPSAPQPGNRNAPRGPGSGQASGTTTTSTTTGTTQPPAAPAPLLHSLFPWLF
jgi:putative peptide zinc metalloprotease protein